MKTKKQPLKKASVILTVSFQNDNYPTECGFCDESSALSWLADIDADLSAAAITLISR